MIRPWCVKQRDGKSQESPAPVPLLREPYSTAGFFGYSHFTGGFPGGQAEYVRVPFADVNCLPIPDDVSDEKGDLFPLPSWYSILIPSHSPLPLRCPPDLVPLRRRHRCQGGRRCWCLGSWSHRPVCSPMGPAQGRLASHRHRLCSCSTRNGRQVGQGRHH